MPILELAGFATRLIACGRWRIVAGEARRRLWSTRLSHGYRRDLDAPLDRPAPGVPVAVRELEERDVPALLDIAEPGLTREGVERRLARFRAVRAKLRTCFVGVAEDGFPCHIQWLVTHRENDAVRRFFGGEIPPLRDDEVLLEYVFTHERYRGKRIHPFVAACLLERAAAGGARWALVYIRDDNFVSQRTCGRLGFRPFVARTERWRFCRRRYAFEALPP